MRATYEDLLRTARRMAVNAHRGRSADEAGLMADWDAVVAATASHLRWLRSRLRSVSRTTRLAGRCSEASLGRLAVAIGAAGDLLATQDPATVSALDQPDDLTAARAELGAIALIGARAVLRNIRTRTPGYEHLLTVMTELESLAQSDVRRVGLGALGGVTAGGPPAPVDDLSLLSRYAARWERAHQSMPPRTLLTRDLRSTTTQLRTVCGHVWHLADQLLAAPAADLDARQHRDLRALKAGLRAFDAGAARVGESWRRRVSDLSGRSSTPGEDVYLDLQAALDRVVRPDGTLLPSADLVPNRRVSAGILDVMDELVWSADQVARRQQEAVRGLILEGRLFVPRREVARLELMYLRRPGGGSRPLQARWVRTNLPTHFDELTDALGWSADHLSAASEVARRLAGTSHHARPAGERHSRFPAPLQSFQSPGIPDPGQEPISLDR